MEKQIGKNSQKLKQLQKIIKSPDQQFMIEGFNLIEEAFKANCLLTLFCDAKNSATLRLKYPKIPIEILLEGASLKLSNVKNGPAVFGLCTKKEKQGIDYSKPIFVLENIQDPGNLGMIIRTLAAFKITNLILINSVCPYNQKVLRAAMGGHFYINWELFNCSNQVIEKLKAANYQLIGLSLAGVKNTNFKLTNKQAFFFGNEGNGLTKQLQVKMDKNILIPIWNIESLNVGVTVALIANQVNNSNVF